MDKNIAKRQAIATKKQRIRKKVFGTSERPRLTVYRSEKHIYGQIVNDLDGKTPFSASTVAKELAAATKELAPIAAAKVIGEALAAKAIAGGVNQVVFDRNGRKYGGRLQAFAEGARGKGLQF